MLLLVLFQTEFNNISCLFIKCVNRLKLPLVSLINVAERMVRIVENERIALHWYSLAMNPLTDKPIDIWSRPIINE